ncbi:hypothetical protein BGZ73_002071 [Actinomortierella ambigua]|nr:hypothetical protein BGZ73_002071 [Actinomortierella ambigua]
MALVSGSDPLAPKKLHMSSLLEPTALHSSEGKVKELPLSGFQATASPLASHAPPSQPVQLATSTSSSKKQPNLNGTAAALLLVNMANSGNNSNDTSTSPRVCKVLEKHPLVKIEWRVPETIKAAGETLRGVVIVSVKDVIGSHPPAQPSNFLAGTYTINPPAIVEQVALELIGVEVSQSDHRVSATPSLAANHGTHGSSSPAGAALCEPAIPEASPGVISPGSKQGIQFKMLVPLNVGGPFKCAYGSVSYRLTANMRIRMGKECFILQSTIPVTLFEMVATGETSTITNPHDQNASHANSGVRFVVPKTNSVLGTAVIRPYSLWGFGPSLSSSSSSSSSSAWDSAANGVRYSHHTSSPLSAPSRQIQTMTRSSSESVSMTGSTSESNSSSGDSSGSERNRWRATTFSDITGVAPRKKGYGHHHRHHSQYVGRGCESASPQPSDSDYESEQRYRRMERLKREREVEEVGFGAHIDKSIVAAGESITLDMFVVKSDLLKVVDIKVSLVETISIFTPSRSPIPDKAMVASKGLLMTQRGSVSQSEQDRTSSISDGKGVTNSDGRSSVVPKRLLESHVVKIAKDYVPAQSEESIKNDKHMKGYYEDFEDSRTAKSLSTYRITMKIPESALTIKDRELISVKYMFVIKYFFKRRVGAFLEIPVEILSQYNHSRISAISGAMSCISDVVQIALPPIPAAVPVSLTSPQVVMDLYPHKEKREESRQQPHTATTTMSPILKSALVEPDIGTQPQKGIAETAQQQTLPHPQSPKKRPPSPNMHDDSDVSFKKSPTARRVELSTKGFKTTRTLEGLDSNSRQQRQGSTVTATCSTTANVPVKVDTLPSPPLKRSNTGGSRSNLPTPINTSLLRTHGCRGSVCARGTRQDPSLSENHADCRSTSERSGDSEVSFVTSYYESPSPSSQSALSNTLPTQPPQVPIQDNDMEAEASSGRPSAEYSAPESPIPSQRPSNAVPLTPSTNILKKLDTATMAVTQRRSSASASQPMDLDPRRLFTSPVSTIDVHYFDDAVGASTTATAYDGAEAHTAAASHGATEDMVSQDILTSAKVTNAETISYLKTNPVEVVTKHSALMAPPQRAVVIDDSQQQKHLQQEPHQDQLELEQAAILTPKIVVKNDLGKDLDVSQTPAPAITALQAVMTTATATTTATSTTPTMAEVLPFSLTSAVPKSTHSLFVLEGPLPISSASSATCVSHSSGTSRAGVNSTAATSSSPSSQTPTVAKKLSPVDPSPASALTSPRLARSIGLLGSFLKSSPTTSSSSISSNLPTSSSSSTLNSIHSHVVSSSSTLSSTLTTSSSSSPPLVPLPISPSQPVVISPMTSPSTTFSVTANGGGTNGGAGGVGSSIASALAASTLPTLTLLPSVASAVAVPVPPPAQSRDGGSVKKVRVVVAPPLAAHHGTKVLVSCLKKPPLSAGMSPGYPYQRPSPTTTPQSATVAVVKKRVTFAKGSTPLPSPTSPRTTEQDGAQNAPRSRGAPPASSLRSLTSPRSDGHGVSKSLLLPLHASLATSGSPTTSSPTSSTTSSHQDSASLCSPTSSLSHRPSHHLDHHSLSASVHHYHHHSPPLGISPNTQRKILAIDGRVMMGHHHHHRDKLSSGLNPGKLASGTETYHDEDGNAEDEEEDEDEEYDEEDDDEYDDDDDDDDDDEEDDEVDQEQEETEEERLERRRIARAAWMAKYGDALQQVYGSAVQQPGRVE